ncbi:MAG TPA: epoxyqueuosine reductase QueH [candidate division Zixibacteria bacterium]
MKLLLHICCSCCLTYPFEKYKKNGVDLVGYWYNPNIHPYTEYRNRLKALKGFAKDVSFPVTYDESYELEKFLKGAMKDLNNRCLNCYLLRLEKTAKHAKEKGFDFFSTTLLISPHQKHKLIKEVGEKIADEVGVDFYYDDLRKGYDQARKMTREKGLYSQKYCGCIFSEKERYLD